MTDYINQQIHQAITSLIVQPEQVSHNGQGGRQALNHSSVNSPTNKSDQVPNSTTFPAFWRESDGVSLSILIKFNLLPPSAHSMTSSAQDFRVQISTNNQAEPTLSFVPKEDQAKVVDYCSWILAWGVFLQTMFVYHNHLIRAHIGYQNIACGRRSAVDFVIM